MECNDGALRWTTLVTCSPHAVMPEVTTVALLGKVRASLYRVPGWLTTSGKPRIAGSIALADVNGILNTLLR